MRNIEIKFTNRWLYTFALIIGVFALGVGVYAVAPNPGHTASQIEGVCLSSGANCPADADTQCDASGVCSQVCIGSDCRGSWPSGGGSNFPNGLTWDKSALVKDQGGVIELGSTNNVANPISGGVPYIDFHYGNGIGEDFNVRIWNDADGRLTLQAPVVRVTGDLDIGHHVGQVFVTLNSNSVSVFCTPGERVTGGGCDGEGIRKIVSSKPVQDGNGFYSGWKCEFDGQSEGSAYVVCANIK